MDYRDIRKAVIVAMFSDDTLMEQFVLKGGNALNIVYGIGGRTSLDVDLSIPADFDDVPAVSARIERVLRDRFQSFGYEVFDYSFAERPRRQIERRASEWGGYRIEFKLFPATLRRLITTDLSLARRSAVAVGPGHSRTFRVEISKHEYCDEKVAFELDDYLIYVYPPFVVAAEKLRALCQQMPAYTGRRKRTPRARDFFDIHAVVSSSEYRAPSNASEIVASVFAAKDVPLSLLDDLAAAREFHRVDWPSVLAGATGRIEPFDFYFDFVLSWARLLKSLSG